MLTWAMSRVSGMTRLALVRSITTLYPGSNSEVRVEFHILDRNRMTALSLALRPRMRQSKWWHRTRPLSLQSNNSAFLKYAQHCQTGQETCRNIALNKKFYYGFVKNPLWKSRTRLLKKSRLYLTLSRVKPTSTRHRHGGRPLLLSPNFDPVR